ncbi:MAG: serine/threonine protein kinase [Candidatus Competibacter sp.]|nr:serine/threonine protein kinase [Candidatus Competibacter sp.]
MALPTVDQYNDAVQHPQTVFTDPELRGARVKTNAFGIPQALGGGFALTYTFTGSKGKKWALRCFHKAVADLGERYATISQTLNGLKSRYFVGFEYQPQGIRINGAAYPIVKMAWVDGETLGSHLDKVYRDKASLLTLRDSFRALEQFLRSQNIAHGDLQNGNVMIGPDMRLIDYDGLYVPGLPTGRGTELGHSHFQHPRRQASDYGPKLDRFSFISIDLALSAVVEKPELFKQFSNGENILFSANDYVDPDRSAAFQGLQAIPALKPAVERFAQICAGSVADVPSLDIFLKPASSAVAVVSRAAARSHSPAGYISAFEVLDGRNFERGLTFVGQRVELIGKITDVRYGQTQTLPPKPYAFINFGHWLGKILKITIWSEGLDNLPDEDRPTPQWIGCWISVTGLLDPPYSSPKFGYTHLSVTVAESSQMRLIREQEARWRLASIGQPKPDLLPIPLAAKTESRPVSKPDSKPGLEPRQQPVPPTPARPNTTEVQRRNQEALAKIRTAAPQPDPILAPAPQSPPQPASVPTSPQPQPAPPWETPALLRQPTLAPTSVVSSLGTAPQPFINRPYPPQSPNSPPGSGMPAWVIWVAIGVFLVWLFNAGSCSDHSKQAASKQAAQFPDPPAINGYQTAPLIPAPNPRETPQTTVPGVNLPSQESRANRNITGKSGSPKQSTKSRVKKRRSSPKSPPLPESGQRWIPVM